MAIEAIYAHVSCADLERSADWFARLFGRGPDARPMASLAEWHHRDGAGLQLFEDAPNAGRQTLTLIVSDLHGEHRRLTQLGLHPGDVEPADTVSLVRLHDPDGSLVVLAEPARG